MKASLPPLYFDPGKDSDFDCQLQTLSRLLIDDAVFLPPQPLGSSLPAADAVVFPQLLGEAYRRIADFRSIKIPIMIVTSEFGTVSMWDWEIIAYLREEGIVTISANDLAGTKTLCRAVSLRNSLKDSRFVVYQNNPGNGQQASIFKRFYWWEDECTRRMSEKFGISIEKRSFAELGQRARELSDQEARAARRDWNLPADGLGERALNAATKLYLAVKNDIFGRNDVVAVGINCLNESHFSDSTPCLAWNRLYQEAGMIWGCEGDTVSMLSKLILNKVLETSVLMTNLYPFQLGQAALKHEKIDHFPDVSGNPDNYLLVAHCGYMGVIPQPFASQWSLRPKVLAIVDEAASAIDARIPTGPITMAKFIPTFERMIATEAELEGYAEYPNSDCRTGGVIRLKDGKNFLSKNSSHHHIPRMKMIADVFDSELKKSDH